MATIGTDPELFLQDKEGTPIPVCGLVGGSKDTPRGLGLEGYAVQEDNVMLEFNVPASRTATEFSNSIIEGLRRCSNLVRTSRDGLALHIVPEQWFPYEDLNTQAASVFGCSVDYRAHLGGQQADVVDPTALQEGEGAWRFAGGHIHLGYDATWEVPDHVVAQFADLFLGLPSMAYDKQPLRRGLYGEAGRYRPTPYGIEYRTLSNRWLTNTSLTHLVGVNALALCHYIEQRPKEEVIADYGNILWADVQAAINNEDRHAAGELLRVTTELGITAGVVL